MTSELPSGAVAKNAAGQERRPWGSYKVLAEIPGGQAGQDAVVKQITVLPGQRLSYQSHQKRREHWQIVLGEGVVTLDGARLAVKAEDRVTVPAGAKHRIANASESGPLVFIEISMGAFDELDIVRYEDDYGRS